jgi:hypothetical protein
LRRFVDTVRYDWTQEVVAPFRFSEFRKGFEWFANEQCPVCLIGGGVPCENRSALKPRVFRAVFSAIAF